MEPKEFMAQLRRDEEYQAKKVAFDAELQERVNGLRAAEQPLVADLRVAGVEVDSVWDLVNTSEPYPDALPVLVDHLERGDYPGRVMESRGRALAVKPAATFWDRLKALYLDARNPGEEGRGRRLHWLRVPRRDTLTNSSVSCQSRSVESRGSTSFGRSCARGVFEGGSFLSHFATTRRSDVRPKLFWVRTQAGESESSPGVLPQLRVRQSRSLDSCCPGRGRWRASQTVGGLTGRG